MWYRKGHVAEKFRYHIGNSDTTSVFSDTTSEIISNRVYLHLSISSHVQILTITNFVICRNKNELKSPGKTYRGLFFILFFAKISATTQKTRIQIDHLLTFNSIITEVKLIDWFLFLIKHLIKRLIFM
jgi:hypothetical protein